MPHREACCHQCCASYCPMPRGPYRRGEASFACAPRCTGGPPSSHTLCSPLFRAFCGAHYQETWRWREERKKKRCLFSNDMQVSESISRIKGMGLPNFTSARVLYILQFSFLNILYQILRKREKKISWRGFSYCKQNCEKPCHQLLQAKL